MKLKLPLLLTLALSFAVVNASMETIQEKTLIADRIKAAYENKDIALTLYEQQLLQKINATLDKGKGDQVLSITLEGNLITWRTISTDYDAIRSNFGQHKADNMLPQKENGCACYQFNKDPRLNLEKVIDTLVQQNSICMDPGIINRIRSAYRPEQQRLNKKAFHPIFPALFYGQQICEKCSPAGYACLKKHRLPKKDMS